MSPLRNRLDALRRDSGDRSVQAALVREPERPQGTPARGTPVRTETVQAEQKQRSLAELKRRIERIASARPVRIISAA